MAELAAYSASPLLSYQNSAVAIARGIRVSLASTGLVAAAASTVRGEGVASAALAASVTGAYFPLQNSAIVPMVADGAISIGDTIYSAASGKVGTTSTGAVIMGKANTAASGDGILFEVIVNNPL